MTNESVEINSIDINVNPNEAHLGILSRSRILPVMVQSAIAIIIDAKNSISMSFKLHKINMEIIKAVIDNNVVVLNFYSSQF